MTLEQRVGSLEAWRESQERRAAERRMWVRYYLGNLVIVLVVVTVVYLFA